MAVLLEGSREGRRMVRPLRFSHTAIFMGRLTIVRFDKLFRDEPIDHYNLLACMYVHLLRWDDIKAFESPVV